MEGTSDTLIRETGAVFPFETITTERLTIRRARPDDAEALWARRNDVETARFQNWTVPYPRRRAEEICASIGAVDGPASGDWWMAIVCDRASGETLGDLALQLTFDGRSAEIGYTFARTAWGHGYATETAAALVDWLFDVVSVSRVHAMTHPENLASIIVLERIGLRFEGHTRDSYWVGHELSDDWLFGMTVSDRDEWRDRPRHPPSSVSLVEITPDNLTMVQALETHRSQRRFVAPVERSLAQALVPPVEDGAPLRPWLRAVEADGEIVGFIMISMITDHHPDPYLWCLLIDRRHQRRGIGRTVLDLVVREARAWGATELGVSWLDQPGTPAPLYLAYGFEPTGEIDHGEVVAALSLV